MFVEYASCLYAAEFVWHRTGVTDADKGASRPPPGKLNVKTGPSSVDILIFSIL